MNENDSEIVDSINNTEETVNDEELKLDLSDDNSEDVETLKKEIATLKAQKEHFKKKAETKVETKVETKEEATVHSQDISQKDYLLLAKSNVDLEDVDEVIDFAKYRKISIAEALQNTTLKAILSDSKEKRQTALATQTSGTRKTNSPSFEALTEKAKKGDISESEIDKLVALRMEAKVNKKL